jgi:hypothetical protein
MAEEMEAIGGYNYTREKTFKYLKNQSPPKYSYVHNITGTAPYTTPNPNLKPSFSEEGMFYPAVTPGQGVNSDVYFDCEGTGEWLWNYTVPFTRLHREEDQSQKFA